MIIVAFPLYKSVPVNWFSSFLAMNKEPVLHYIVMMGPYVTASMQRIVEECLAVPGWDRLVVMEHDMIMPLDGFVKADQYPPEFSIVGPMYFGHTKPYHPIVYVRDKDAVPQYNALSTETVKAWSDHPGLYEVDAVGLGFTSIARHVLEDWPEDVAMFQQDVDWGHDIWFCKTAQEIGHKVYVDTYMQCDHLTEVPINIYDNLSIIPD
jgi:hypothetical protein